MKPQMYKINATNATIEQFRKITKFVYIITATNFWFEDIELPEPFKKVYNYVSKILEVFIVVFVITGVGARYTQNLTDKQNTDVLMKSLSSFFVYTMYRFTVYHKTGIRELLYTLTVTLKEMYNNKAMERKMINKIKLYLIGLVVVGCCPMIAYGVEGTFHSLMSNEPFTTIIPIWPDLEDRRPIAGITRIFIYIIWLLLVARVISIYSIIICAAICLGYQFANLHEYFLSLDNIFEEGGKEEEIKYENALTVGIKMHCMTLNCVNKLQTTCSVAFSGQVVINVTVLLFLMIQMMQSERSLVELAPIIFMATGVLVSSGLFIWSAGDITFEAARLPMAIFHSGWYHCGGQSSVRVRKMITIALMEAQQIVTIKGLGIIELSYQSYVSIVKSSYSAFSVVY